MLDNPLWHWLANRLAPYVTGTELAKVCSPSVINIAAIGELSDAAFRDLAGLVQSGESTALFRANPPDSIPGLALENPVKVDQLICERRTPLPQIDVPIVELGELDIPEMAQLIELTQPGLFVPAIVPLTRWLGVRQQGKLIAVAGERASFPSYGEVGTVCTHPEWRGRGYAKSLSLAIMDEIWRRDATPYLYVFRDNTPAYQLYESLHFVKRSEISLVGITRL